MDSTTLSPEKLELSTVRRDEDNDEVIASFAMYLKATNLPCRPASLLVGQMIRPAKAVRCIV